MKFNYRVEFSARRTMSLSISCDNQIVVRCPFKTPQDKINSFVASKSSWLEKHIKNNRARNDFYNEVINYKKVLVGGLLYDFKLDNANFVSDGVVVAKSFKDLKDILIAHCGDAFMGLYESFGSRFNLKANTVSFKDYKGRWGCCDSKNNIVFNYKLLMLPRELQLYVIVHELCHIEYHDHSKDFWNLVEQILPDYKQFRKELQSYAFLAKLY